MFAVANEINSIPVAMGKQTIKHFELKQVNAFTNRLKIKGIDASLTPNGTKIKVTGTI